MYCTVRIVTKLLKGHLHESIVAVCDAECPYKDQAYSNSKVKVDSGHVNSHILFHISQFMDFFIFLIDFSKWYSLSPLGGAGAAALGSVAGIYIIGSIFGVAGAGLAGYKMNKRVGDLEEFEFEALTEGRQLHVTVAVSGWLTEENPGNW